MSYQQNNLWKKIVDSDERLSQIFKLEYVITTFTFSGGKNISVFIPQRKSDIILWQCGYVILWYENAGSEKRQICSSNVA